MTVTRMMPVVKLTKKKYRLIYSGLIINNIFAKNVIATRTAITYGMAFIIMFLIPLIILYKCCFLSLFVYAMGL